MASDNATSGRSFLSALFLGDIYKRNQGRIVRQITCLAMWAVTALAAWRLYEAVMLEATFGFASENVAAYLRRGIPLVLLAAGMWLGYRLVNWPRFADFLISVEAEMHKVSWPTRTELVRASMVVIFVIFFLAMLLFSYDLIWSSIFQYLNIS
jgi:preprotein translocase subunit SecE